MVDIGFTHIALPVRSLSASIEFYAAYANMQVIHRRHGVAWLSDRTRPFAIVLIETSNEIKPLLPMAHLGVSFKSMDEVNQLCQRAKAEGSRPPPRLSIACNGEYGNRQRW